jgi:hypothetical protein
MNLLDQLDLVDLVALLGSLLHMTNLWLIVLVFLRSHLILHL